MPAADRPFQCPICRRHLHSYPSLKRHLGEHKAPTRGQKCGKPLRPHESHYCRCA